MIRKMIFLVVLLLGINLYAEEATTTPSEDITSLVTEDYALADDNDFPGLVELSKGKVYYIVLGFMNELYPNYFEFLKEYLIENLKVPRDQVVVIRPKSYRSVAENSTLVANQISDEMTSKFSGKKAVVIGHSKGGAETLLSVVKNPEISMHLEKVLLIQGAFKGSQLVDFVCQKGCRLSDKIPFRKRLVLRILKMVAGSFVKLKKKGFMSLQPENSTSTLNSALSDLTPAQRDLIEPKIYFVRSYENPNENSDWMSRYTGAYLEAHNGVNDGLLTLDSQHPEIGTDLGVMKAGHSDFAGTIYPYLIASEYAHSFYRVIFTLMFKNEITNSCTGIFNFN